MSIPRVIIVIASSLDGRIAFPEGGESHLGSEEDRKMLDQNLSMVDATIFGLGTLKAHESTYLIKNHKSNPISTYRNSSNYCLLYTSPSPRDSASSRMPSSA